MSRKAYGEIQRKPTKTSVHEKASSESGGGPNRSQEEIR